MKMRHVYFSILLFLLVAQHLDDPDKILIELFLPGAADYSWLRFNRFELSILNP